MTRNFRVLLSALPILLSACSTLTPQQQSARDELVVKHHSDFKEPADFYKAIKADNLPAVKLFMATRDGYPFAQYVSDSSTQNKTVSGAEVLTAALDHPDVLQYLLSCPATSDDVRRDALDYIAHVIQLPKNCDEPGLGMLINSASKAPENVRELAAKLYGSGCEASFDNLLKKFPEGAQSSYLVEAIRQELKSYDHSGFDSAKKEQYDKILSSLEAANQKGCNPKSIEACRLVDEIKALQAETLKLLAVGEAKRTARKADDEQREVGAQEYQVYVTSGDQARDQACKAIADEKLFMSMLADEREVGKTSGYVNMARMNEYGRMLFGSRDFLKSAKATYKEKTGREFKVSYCTHSSKSKAPITGAGQAIQHGG